MRMIDADALIEFCAERWIPLNIDAVNMQPTIQLEKAQLSQEGTTKDTISRQAAIEAVDSETVITNPEHFKSNEKFIKFMDDSDISSFGKWQWANGFNTALVATRIHLKKLPSAQPEPSIPLSWVEKHIEWLKGLDNEFANLAAAHISVMVKKWRGEQHETD